ncbi:MAG TPA: serine/threonine-protein kinase, partial [Thermoanaerobaculia bacterium]|nr:serine/threonine-protein kinase [Thermoanaerobaculia bacterium]
MPVAKMICPRCSSPNPEEAAVCASCGEDLLEQADTLAAQPGDSRHRLSDWQRKSRESRELPAGFEIGSRYRVGALLGRGGMGAVYRVHDNELERDVALKMIRPEIDDPNVIERFKREIQLSSIVTHRNVLRVYDLGESGGVKYLTMQLVEGEDLATLVRRDGPLPVDRAVRIFRQICEGLAAAHEQGVLHRDLKPANVMIGTGDHVYLTDFGLARTSDQPGLTASGAVVGTPDYMSPEQVKAMPLDHRSDIYSLGVILFQLLTRDLPFRGRSSYEVMIERVQHEAPRVSTINPRIPESIARVAQRCLAMNPEQRYQSVEEILDDLGGPARTPAARKSKWMFAAAAALALVLLGGAIVWTFSRGGEAPLSAAAEQKPVTVLVADLDNRSGDPIFDETLEPILTIGLE